MENVISEFRLIETDDGYRIEIKGDKEQMKSFMKDHHRHRSHGWRRNRGWGPWGYNPEMWRHMASCWDASVEADESDSEAQEE